MTVSTPFSCVGLDVETSAEFSSLVVRARVAAVRLGGIPPGVEVFRWEDASGARLVLETVDGRLAEAVASFAGVPGASLGGLAMLNETVASAAVLDEDGDQVTALAFELEQRRLLPPGARFDGVSSIVALGLAVEVFADEAAFARSEASLLVQGEPESDPPAHYVAQGWAWPPRVAAESFISYGVFADAADATAGARLAGTVLHARRHTVSLTGQSFTAARVRTAGFEVDVCLAGPDHPEPVTPGQVVAGEVSLVGSMESLVESGPTPRKPFWRRR